MRPGGKHRKLRPLGSLAAEGIVTKPGLPREEGTQMEAGYRFTQMSL